MRIAQKEEYRGSDWWSWAVWIDGKAEELRTVEAVIYTLDPSFAHPVRKVTDRRSKFRLTETGWGGFTVYARVILKSGKERNLKHELTLYYPEGQEADSFTIHVNAPQLKDPGPQVNELQAAIQNAAPDARIERKAASKRGDKTAPAALSVPLTGRTLFSVGKGIQDWLTKNPRATVDLQKGQEIVKEVTASNVLKTLSLLRDSTKSESEVTFLPFPGESGITFTPLPKSRTKVRTKARSKTKAKSRKKA